MAYEFEDAPVNITSLGSGIDAAEPTAIQYHTNRIVCIYRKGFLLYTQYSDDRGLTWTAAAQAVDDDNAKYPSICRNYNDGWALAWAAYTNDSDLGLGTTVDWEVKFVQALSTTSIIADLLDVSVDKGVDMTANQLKVTIAQEDSQYDFQNPGTMWEGQLIPGNGIEFYAGLGDNLDKRFKGIIDVVDYRDAEGVIEISARSRANLLLDGKFNAKTQYKTSQTYQEVASAILVLAGFETDEFHIEGTLVTLAEEKVIDREESYLSGLQDVMDDMGWIIWEDEDGMIWIETPTEYPSVLWNYYLNVNCFSFSRNLDKINVPSSIVVSNEEANIQKSADIDPQDFVILNDDEIEYIETKEDDAANIQAIADARRDEVELKLFTIDVMVPYNFYLQLRDRVQIHNTPMSITNVGVVTRAREVIGRKGLRNTEGLYSHLSVAVIS